MVEATQGTLYEIAYQAMIHMKTGKTIGVLGTLLPPPGPLEEGAEMELVGPSMQVSSSPEPDPPVGQSPQTASLVDTLGEALRPLFKTVLEQLSSCPSRPLHSQRRGRSIQRQSEHEAGN